MFSRKGEISIPKEAASEDKLLDLVLEAGAEDLKDDGSAWYIVTPPDALEAVKEALSKAGITPASAETRNGSTKLREADRHASAANVASRRSARRARRRAARLRELRHRRKRNSSRRRRKLIFRLLCGAGVHAGGLFERKLLFHPDCTGSLRAFKLTAMNNSGHSRLVRVLGVDPAAAGPPATESWKRKAATAASFTTALCASGKKRKESAGAALKPSTLSSAISSPNFSPRSCGGIRFFRIEREDGFASRGGPWRGLACRCAASSGGFSYAPREVKASVAGYGHADKRQMQTYGARPVGHERNSGAA